MAYTFEELRAHTVAQLREIAKENDHEALRGFRTMHKEQLVLALSTALGIEAHEHHEAVGIDKGRLKAEIRSLKVQRDAALAAHDSAELKHIRRRIKRLKHRIRKATV